MLLKVDTEGNEKRVLSGAMVEYFRDIKVQNEIEVLDVMHEICSYGYGWSRLKIPRFIAPRQKQLKLFKECRVGTGQYVVDY
jgi:hypothetical protein